MAKLTSFVYNFPKHAVSSWDQELRLLLIQFDLNLVFAASIQYSQQRTVTRRNKPWLIAMSMKASTAHILQKRKHHIELNFGFY